MQATCGGLMKQGRHIFFKVKTFFPEDPVSDFAFN